MEGNRELEQLDAEARALKATLMRYLSEALLEDPGLGKLTAELTRITQASQRHSVEATARAEQKIQALAASVDAVRAEMRTLLTQSHEHVVREVRAVVAEQLNKKKKAEPADEVAERLDRLQLEVRNLARALQMNQPRAVAADVDAEPRRGRRPMAARARMPGNWSNWIALGYAAPLAALLVVSVGYNVWQATRKPPILAAVTMPERTKPLAGKTTPAAPAASPNTALASPIEQAAAVSAALKQTAWDNLWKSALELPLQQCWPEAKSTAKVAKFRDCACPVSKDSVPKDKTDKDAACEWSPKWSGEASAAALQAVLSVAAAKTITIDAKVGTGTFNAIDVLVRDCGFKDAALTAAIEELRTTRGKAPADGREPATAQILGFLKMNLHSCR